MGTKILIADDESDIVSMLGSFFESKGFRVLPAFNGAEALKPVSYTHLDVYKRQIAPCAANQPIKKPPFVYAMIASIIV